MIGFKSTRIWFIWTLIFIFSASSLLAQQQKNQGSSDDEPVKLQTTLVQVPVIVKDRTERYLTDLKKSEFKLFENGIEQEVTFFGTVEEPFNVALLIDSSGSTVEKLNQIKAAASAFIETLRPHDRVMVMEFNDSVTIHAEMTGNRDALHQAISRIQPGEFTQVYEAVYTAVWERLANMKGRKAVILFSDGIDNASTELDEEDTFAAITESEDVIVYPIRYNTREDVEHKLELKYANQVLLPEQARATTANLTVKKPPTFEEALRDLDRTYRQADEYLYELARLSGGVVERADRLTDLQSAFGRIADELRKQYLIGYYPKDEKSEIDRRIVVKVTRPDARVRARPGYKVGQ
ncbi:MAG: VWA domain-containing protein [Acidobacteriota bacterium]